MGWLTYLKATSASIPTPSTGKVSQFVDSADGVPKYKDETGTVTALTGPTGPTGPTGATGAAATISAGTATGLSTGSPPTVSNSGSSSAAVFDFGIPAGATGATGPTGPTGATGTAATIAAGTATTLAPSASPTVSNSGSSSAAVFDFGIPGPNTLLTTSGAPSSGTGNNGDYAIDPAAQLIYGPKSGGAWPAGVNYKGNTGATGATGATGSTGGTGAAGNSLNRPSATLTPSAGVATINVTTGAEVYILTLAANVTSWVFNNLPSAGTVAEIRIKVIQASGGTQYTCVSPATAGNTAGGAWINSSAAGAIESIGLAIDSSGTVAVFPSGVYA